MKKAKRKASTAISRLVAPKPRKTRPEIVLNPKPTANAPRVLTDDIDIGSLGLQELKLTPDEEAILAQRVNVSDLMVKPTKSGQVYLPHPVYTNWFNRAFGRLGWTLTPISKPLRSGSIVVVNYVLYIHGVAVAWALGEQEYLESNKEQTYGDAIESTVASALRRCAKRLGVGLELWNKDFLDNFLADHCLMVSTEKGMVWRRKDGRPVRGEQISGQRQAPQGQRRPPPDAIETKALNPQGEETITVQQQKILGRTATKMERDAAVVVAYLKRRYHVATSAAIKRKDYEAILRDLERPGDLP